MDEQPGLPAEVRAGADPTIQAYLAFQDRHIAAMREQIAGLQGELANLHLRLADAQARARQHSGNSSRPPSGRERGGQPGHPGHAHLTLATDEMAAVMEHRPSQCPSCMLPLDPSLPAEGEPLVRQVWEIPLLAPQVTEHRGDSVRCPHCDVLVPAAGLPDGAFGPRLTAIGGLLHGRYRLSMRETARMLDDLFGVPLAIGSVAALCREVSGALDEPYAAVREHVTGEDHANVDETGWKQAGERRWLWVAVTALCTLFVVAANRSAAVLLALLGEGFDGVVSSDRSKAYRSIPLERRQICWAHLKRPLLGFAERGGEIGDWGKEAVAAVKGVFVAWHRSKDDGDRVRLQEEIAPLRRQLQGLWERGATLPSWVARAFCNDVRKLEPALWTFAAVEGVEPTNNAVERALRPAVLWRKGCFGADSPDGNSFVARILTVAATCRQQKRPLVTYLTQAVSAYRDGSPAPSLLPV
jgi:transposase